MLFAYVHRWLLDDAYERLIVDVSAERVAFFWRFGLYAVFGAALMAVNIAIDYAKVRLVVEDRRSAIGALSAALGFLRRHPGRALRPLRAQRAGVPGGCWRCGRSSRPAPAAPGCRCGLAFAATQLYLLARLVLKLQFMASQTALFQRSLAHAGYTAAPVPRVARVTRR